MIYRRPVIKVLKSLDAFFERLLPRTVPPPPNTDWRAKKLKEFIDQHQGEVRWKLGDACKQVGFPVSDRQARRLFKVSTGMGIKEYAKNKRLGWAAEQLRATNVPVKVIATDLGYQRTSEFARTFKVMFLLKPMEFRRLWRRRGIVRADARKGLTHQYVNSTSLA